MTSVSRGSFPAKRSRLGRSPWKWTALVLVLVTASYFCRGFLHRFREKTYPPNAFYQVKRGDMLISLVEEGALRALNETVIRSGLEGYNRIIHLVPEGSYVQKGDLLVELDSSGLRDRLNEQELLYQDRLFQMEQAKGNLEIQKSLVESDIKDAELRIENAQSDLEKYRDGDAPLLVKTVEARSGVLAEQVRIAMERYARTEDLFKSGKATKSELEADALSLKREQLGLGQYQEDLRLIKKYDQPNRVRQLQSEVEQAKAELERLRHRTSNEIAQAEADLKTSQSALDFLEESLNTQKRRLENAKMFAPQNGLVVYSSVSPFQFGGDEPRRDEGRFRLRGSGFGNDRPGEFRGGGRRGSLSRSENRSGGGSSSSTAEAMASGNQRIASAISGTSVTEPNPGGGGQNSANPGGGSSGGGRSSGGASGDGSSQGTASAASAFASYASMRPSSAFAYSGASGTNGTGNGAGGGTASSLVSTGSQSSSFGNGNQFTSRSSGQNFRDFGGFDVLGTPGFLQEGTMVRMRQELIRLPDVSKMLAEVKVNESRVSQIRPGMTAYVQVKTIPGRHFKGTVRRVAPLPDAQASWMNPNVKVYPADIVVDEELPLLKPGVSAVAEIIITNLTKVLSVPIQTVARFRGENVCFVKRGSHVAPVPVTTGWFNDLFIEITSGLKEGDRVLLAPVSDEEIEDTSAVETNQVDGADGKANVPVSQPPLDESSGEERRMRRRDSDSPNGSISPERRRNRDGSGRQRPNSQDAPE